jgi:nicotinamidase-related amidase
LPRPLFKSWRTDNIGDTFESNPELADELKERDVGTIVAFGIQSECCVLSTCRGALAAGFRVVLLRGAHSTYDADGKTAAEIEGDIEGVLEHEGVEVVDWESWSPGA